MVKIRSLAGGVLLAALGAAPAGAALTTYYHAGSWHVFSGTDATNRLVCGLGTENAQDGRSLTITAAIGAPGLTFRATKPSWTIPAGTPVPVILVIGREPAWSFQATGKANEATWSLDPTQAAAFDPAFRGAAAMALSFPAGSEPPWTISLAGSNAADHTFVRCINDLTRRTQAAPGTAPGTAPSAPAAGPTQPYGAPATQPFAPQAASGAAAPADETPGAAAPAAAPAATKPGG